MSSNPGTNISLYNSTPAEISTQYGNYSESIRTHELDNYAHAYMIILIILFVILIIILVAIAINLVNIGQDLKQKLVIPIIEKMESAESKLASVEARTGEMADRIREWDGMVSDVHDMDLKTEDIVIMEENC